MPRPDYESFILNDHDDILRIRTASGMLLEFPVSPEDMVELNKWAFTRKTFHILSGIRKVDPFTPIPQGRSS